MFRPDWLPKSSLASAVVGLVATLWVPAAFAAGDLKLRVSDAEGVPGGVVALVLRTYESQPIGQGQGCFFVRNAGGPVRAAVVAAAPVAAALPFGEYLGAEVFARAGDEQHRVSPAPGADGFLLRFLSPSGSINEVGGPLAVVYFRLRPDLVPGETFDIGLDLTDTFLFDDLGAPIPVSLRGGTLTVRAAGSPIAVAADAGKVLPGEWATVAFQTSEPVPLSEGRVTLLYDETIAAGEPLVVADPRFGKIDLSVDLLAPGRVEVSFSSPDGSLNRLPGDLLQFAIPTRSDVPPGTNSTVAFEPSTSWLVDRLGQTLDLAFESDVIEFVVD